MSEPETNRRFPRLRLPEPPPPPGVALAPSARLVARVLPAPAGLGVAERRAAAELAFEAESPFPTEHLRLGVAAAPGSTSTIALAALAERLEELPDAPADPALVVPAALPWLEVEPAEADRTILVADAEGVVALLVPAGATAPAAWRSRPGATGDDTAAATVAADLLARLRREPRAWPAPGALHRVRAAHLADDGGVSFEIETSPWPPTPGAAPDATNSTVPEARALAADLGEPSLAGARRRERRVARWTERAFLAAAAALALLLLVRGGVAGGRIWHERRAADTRERAAQVARLESQQTLRERIDQFATNPLRPFALLAVANRVRQDSVHFTRVTAEDRTLLRVEGEAGDAESVNVYADLLGAAPEVQETRLERVVTRDGRSPFTLEVRFRPTEDAAAAAPAAADPGLVAPETSPVP